MLSLQRIPGPTPSRILAPSRGPIPLWRADLAKPSSKLDRIGAGGEAQFDAGLADADPGIRVHDVVEDMSGAATLVAIAEGLGGVAVHGARHEGQAQVGIDLGLDDG